VLTVAPAISLARQVGALRKGHDDNDPRLIAAVSLARVLAHIKEHTIIPPLRAAGWKAFPDDRRKSDVAEERPRLSEARFRRLIETGPGEEQVVAFVRLVRLLDGHVNVSAIAADFLDWSQPVRRDRVRQRWAFDYYAAGAAAPAQSPVSEDDD
jgi:CRISPR type I-E-associated protein CasB/Cse2